VKLQKDKQDEIINDGSVAVSAEEAERLGRQMYKQLNADQRKVHDELLDAANNQNLPHRLFFLEVHFRNKFQK